MLRIIGNLKKAGQSKNLPSTMKIQIQVRQKKAHAPQNPLQKSKMTFCCWHTGKQYSKQGKMKAKNVLRTLRILPPTPIDSNLSNRAPWLTKSKAELKSKETTLASERLSRPDWRSGIFWVSETKVFHII